MAGSGNAVTASGASVSSAGESIAGAATDLWDFSSGDINARPVLDEAIGLPAAAATSPKPRDPSPGEMFKQDKS